MQMNLGVLGACIIACTAPGWATSPTDLDVTYIERTPRYNYDAAKNNPAPGDDVVFTAHIINWGATTLNSVAYRWQIDSAVPTSALITSIAPGSEATVTLPWTWQSGNHTVAFTIDPSNAILETSEINNTITDRVNAIIAGFWVEQAAYAYFHEHQKELNIGSNSWQDWIQRQMARQNSLYASAIYPLSPHGVLDRVRIDKIVVVPDGALPLNGGLATNNPDLRDKTVDLMWGFPASQIAGTFYANLTSTDVNNPFYLEGSLLHELGHARYLVDQYGYDVHNTYNPSTGQGYDSVKILENGVPVAGSALMPFIAFDEVLYYNKSGGVMTGPYGFVWSPYEAAALNLIAGRRAQCGNYNAPCNIGAFLNDLPQRNFVRFVDGTRRPVSGADVRVYQAVGGPGWYGKTFDNTPDLLYTTDTRGIAAMPRNPFSSGSIQNTYGLTNGVAILRVQHSSGLWYRFMEVTDFNMQFWSGATVEASYTITLPGAVGTVVYTVDDATRALQIAAGLASPTTGDMPGLDSDGVSGITVRDAAIILRMVLRQ